MILTKTNGLSFEFSPNGTVAEIRHHDLRLNMRKSDLHSQSGTALYLRWPESNTHAELSGPTNCQQFSVGASSFLAEGHVNGFHYQIQLLPAAEKLMWKWQVTLVNHTAQSQKVELFCMQDVALKQAISSTMNAYYASQYLERLMMLHPHYGKVVCCRQNMKEGGKNPWLMMACREGATAAFLDGMSFYGKSYRETAIPEAMLASSEGSEYAGESSLLALRSQTMLIDPKASVCCEFSFILVEDHPQASSTDDLEQLNTMFESQNYPIEKQLYKNFTAPIQSLFYPQRLLSVEALNSEDIQHYFGADLRMQEVENDQLLSFFYDENSHVALKSKELQTDRPHGHILQALRQLTPDEMHMSTNPFAAGVFNAHLTQGNTNFNILLSIYSNQFHLASEVGQRIFLEYEDEYFLLGVPSAFEMGLNHCRWIYKTKNTVIQFITWTTPGQPQVNFSYQLLQGKPLNLLVSHHFDPSLNWTFKLNNPKTLLAFPGAKSMTANTFPEGYFSLQLQQLSGEYAWIGDSVLRTDGLETSSHFRVLKLQKCEHFTMSFMGALASKTNLQPINNAQSQFKADFDLTQQQWNDLSGGLRLYAGEGQAEIINEILPWFGSNTLIHFLTPYGLEQFGGAAWGTRDVSQGPVDFLLHLEKFTEARKVLCMIFSHQNPDGGWPQWWMFDKYYHIRAHEAHGDIIYWPIIALSKYIEITADLGILQEKLPYYHPKGIEAAEYASLAEHLDRLISMIINSFMSGTALVPFGGGDWNDSLQPVSEDLAERMVSSWTVMMNYQAFRMYAKILDISGKTKEAAELNYWAERIRSDLNEHLMKDGIVAGYGMRAEDGSFDLLLHPADTTTGIQYSLLPMNRGVISEIFTKEQVDNHQQIIQKQLLGPDGARLMDKPLQYKGGVQTIFQRAESSTFFGREIGLMYIHEHIRYAEALAKTGKADAFLHALLQVVPVQYRQHVANSDLRQANCYYSSSDIAFNNRYEADQSYALLHSGLITFRGGWRVYSSGPGIFIGLVVSALIGLNVRNEAVIFDPVIPASLNGMQASLRFKSHKLNIKYIVENQCYSPKKIVINGKELSFEVAPNPYRNGGALVPLAYLLECLNHEMNDVEITL